MPSLRRRILTQGLTCLLGLPAAASAEFEVVHAFTAAPAFSWAGLVRASDGALYGTTKGGGTGAAGTLFRVDPDGTFHVLHDFREPLDGSAPEVPLVEGADGALYGLTITGGDSDCVYGCGTIFGLDPGGTFRVLHRFGARSTGGERAVAMILGSDGRLYGTTPRGGSSDTGSVFRIDSGGNFSLLHSFAGSGEDGAWPASPLVQDQGGALYGSTRGGGESHYGTLFRIDGGGVLTSLHAFSGTDGAYPQSALVQGEDGAFYGLTPCGGSHGAGSVFRLERTGEFTSLHSFDLPRDGGFCSDAYPPSYTENHAQTLARGSDGMLYGSTPRGGTSGLGTLFRIDGDGGFHLLHSFNAQDGAAPRATLVLKGDGAVYGTTSAGGSFGDGTLFRLHPDGRFESLHSFRSLVDGAGPQVPLASDGQGALWGTTFGGGPHGSGGTVFRVDPTGCFSVVHAFGNSPEGEGPDTALVPGGDGALYGMTPRGGGHGVGTIFQLDGADALTVVHDFEERTGYGLFAASNGSVYGSLFDEPFGSLFEIRLGGSWRRIQDFDGPTEGSFGVLQVEGEDGTFYGTAGAGGASNHGTVFRMEPDASVTALHSFERRLDGESPRALTVASNGALYGVTQFGGPFGAGTLFRIDPTGAFRSLHTFSYGDGAYPESPLVEARPGQLYGTNRENGPFGAGTAFKIDLDGAFAQLHGFDGTVEGIWAHGPLVQGPDGALYGVTQWHSDLASGAVFRIRADDAVEVLHLLDESVDGRNPGAPLVLAGDGFFYGRTFQGGAFGAGTVFRIDTRGSFELLRTLDPAVDGALPVAPLTLGRDGAVYGTTSRGGPGGAGTVFRVRSTCANSDGDALCDAADNCPFYTTANTADADLDGRGDACECGDQDGNGRNTVSDLVAIRLAIFNPSLVTPLCDGNNDGACNVNDIVAAALEIFSPTSTSICAGQPEPGP